MQYLCLICAEKVVEQMDERAAEQCFEEYGEFTANLRSSGQLVACNRLEPASTATTVRVRQGKVSAVDGPYAETKEQLGGYYVIEARDLNEAIRIAARIPGARMGCVEIRPVARDVRTLNALGMAAPGVGT